MRQLELERRRANPADAVATSTAQASCIIACQVYSSQLQRKLEAFRQNKDDLEYSASKLL